MEKDFRSEIAELLEEPAAKAAAAEGLVPLHIHVRGTQHNPVIEVILDGTRLVTIEDCSQVSRSLHEYLETTLSISKNFRLDVLSPGLEEPIVHDWQFKRNIGRLVEIHHAVGGESVMIHGRLCDYSHELVGLAPVQPKNPRSTNKAEALSKKAGGSNDLIGEDEQNYEPIVAEVMVPRAEILKMTVVPEFS